MGEVKIVVDGMTGSGKTTITNTLAKRLGLKVMPEEFRDPYDLLNKYSQDEKWCFPMQLNFLVTRYIQYTVASESSEYILDRSIYSDPVYAQLYYKIGHLNDTEFDEYQSLYSTLTRSLTEPKCLLLLDCSFKEIMNRIEKRGREDELRLGANFWEKLHYAYKDHLENLQQTFNNCIYINTEEFDILNNEEHVDKVVKMVSEKIKGFSDKNIG